MDTGTRQTVYLAREGGVIEPRAVETGARFGEMVEIRKGLAAGDRVVSSGNFLIDSESQMKAAGDGPPMPSAAEEAAPHGGGHRH